MTLSLPPKLIWHNVVGIFPFWDLLRCNTQFLTLRYTGKKMLLVTRGVVIMATPSYHAKMKLQMHVRGQNRGFLGCPIHLAYCQMSSMCISRVFTCLYIRLCTDLEL